MLEERAAINLDRILAPLDSERVCWGVLAFAMALSAGTIFWFTRGITFHADDYFYFVGNQGFHPKVLLGPHNGHLILIPRLLYAIVLKLAGAKHYVIFTAWQCVGIALVAAAFFVLAKRRIPPAAALAPSVLLLFLGSTWQNSLDPVGVTHVYCIAAGLWALVALDRPSLRNDLIACALLIVSIATFTVGVMFALAAAVLILAREDRRRRAWVFLIPLILLGAWMASPRLNTTPFQTGTSLQLSNALLIPGGVTVAAAATSAAISGLAYNFADPASYTIDSPVGYLLAAIALVLFVKRLRRGSVPLSLWAAAMLLGSYWVGTIMTTHPLAEPNQNRYLYDGAVFVLLLGAEVASGVQIKRSVLAALLAVTAVALVGNLASMRVGGFYMRTETAPDRAMLAAEEIARDHISPSFIPKGEATLQFLSMLTHGAGAYLSAADRNGSYAFTPAELRGQSEAVKEIADQNLGSALNLQLSPLPASYKPRECLPAAGPGAGPVDVPIPRGGLVLSSTTAQPITLRRYAVLATVSVGTLAPGSYSALAIPADRAPADAWHLVTSGGPLTVCKLG